MAIAIIEITGKKENSFMDIFSNNSADTGGSLKLIGNRTFETKEKAEEFLVNNVVPDLNIEATKEYERISKHPSLYDLENLDKGLKEGHPLIAKNIFFLNVEAFYILKGFPNKEKDVEDTKDLYNKLATVKRTEDDEAGGALFELKNGKIFYRCEGLKEYISFQTFEQGVQWLSGNKQDNTLIDKTMTNDQYYNWLKQD